MYPAKPPKLFRVPESQIYGWDTETDLISEEKPTPDLACITLALPSGEKRIFGARDGVQVMTRLLELPEPHLVAHNAEFDARVIIRAGVPRELVTRAYNKGRLGCTKVLARMIDMQSPLGVRGAKGWYSLAGCMGRELGIHVEKEDTWRLRYGELIGTPVEEWPAEARDYALDDAGYVRDLAIHYYRTHGNIPDVERQTAYDFWLGATSARGMYVEAARVLELVETTKDRLYRDEDALVPALVREGILEPKTRGRGSAKKVIGFTLKSKPIEALVLAEYGEVDVPRTDKGAIKTDADTLNSAAHPTLEMVAAYKRWADVLTKDLKYLSKPVVRPRFGLANTGRTTASEPNTQNMKKGMPIRQCFVPRPGYIYLISDYSGLELHTLGQACLKLIGRSTLAEVLNTGKDPHTLVAASILSLDYDVAAARKKDPNDKEFDSARQTGKVANFGLPGGMGVRSFISFAKASYDVKLSVAEAEELKANYFRAYPEMRDYFRHISNLGDKVEHLFSGRIRSNKSYTSSCNTYFQGLGADVAKMAGWLIYQATHNEQSPLFGGHIVNFEHDCFIVEIPYDLADPERNIKAHAAANELERLMVEGPAAFVPDVPLKTEPCMAWRWDKKAEAVFDDNGTMIPWGDMPLFGQTNIVTAI